MKYKSVIITINYVKIMNDAVHFLKITVKFISNILNIIEYWVKIVYKFIIFMIYLSKNYEVAAVTA